MLAVQFFIEEIYEVPSGHVVHYRVSRLNRGLLSGQLMHFPSLDKNGADWGHICQEIAFFFRPSYSLWYWLKGLLAAKMLGALRLLMNCV
jgi:hypothetical protein